MIQEIEISKLKTAPYNPRKISKHEFAKLKKSLEQDRDFFTLRPCIANKRNGDLIVFAGNQRLQAAKALGWKKVPCIIVTVSEAQEKEWNLKDNNSAGEYDFKAIAQNFDMAILDRVGMRAADLRKIQEISQSATPSKPEIEFTEELNEEHNYVVFYFKNSVDWLWLQSLLPLPTVKALDSKPGFEKKGVARVVDGVKAIRQILKNAH